jgi:hypothetical protein
MSTLLKAKVIELDRRGAETLGRDRLSKMGHPTLSELCDPTKTVYSLTWLVKVGQNYRIER